MNTAPEIVSTALRMLTALGIVLGGLLVCVYFIKRFLKKDVGGSKEQLIKVIASQYIGIKKNISLVEIPGSILVVGVSNDNISLLTKIEDEVVLDVLRQENSRITPSFSDHLQRLTGRFKQARNSSGKRV
jgi:flagellar protein FliO/FliZ